MFHFVKWFGRASATTYLAPACTFQLQVDSTLEPAAGSASAAAAREAARAVVAGRAGASGGGLAPGSGPSHQSALTSSTTCKSLEHRMQTPGNAAVEGAGTVDLLCSKEISHARVALPVGSRLRDFENAFRSQLGAVHTVIGEVDATEELAQRCGSRQAVAGSGYRGNESG